MRILALIPARGGSKRLPGKNIKPLGGKPLINWTIESVKGIVEVCDVLVSTDHSEIASTAKTAGAFVPWLRPPELATDKATTVDVALHALDWYEKEKGHVDGLLLLQPTSPFRTRDSINQSIQLFVSSQFQTVVSISPVSEHPMWALKIVNAKLVPFIETDSFGQRSQDLPPAYVINGGIYLISPKMLRMKKSFFNEETIGFETTSPKESLDIDTEWDFKLAELQHKDLGI